MSITGRCYCGDLRYETEAAPMAKGACHCRECQYITGGAANLFMVMPAAGFTYVEGEPKGFSRADLDGPATREFCENCGTHILTRTPRNPAIVILKVGTLDDSSLYDGPQMAIWTDDKQPYHLIADGVATFPKFPG
jgi:hypothetical protein